MRSYEKKWLNVSDESMYPLLSYCKEIANGGGELPFGNGLVFFGRVLTPTYPGQKGCG
jgi:hypothetical protein